MHHHLVNDYARTVEAERLAVAAKRRSPADGGELERLVAAAAAGESTAWDALVARFAPVMLRIARSCGLGRHEAEDAVQNAWIRLLRGIELVREPHAIGAWLATTTRRESLRLRQQARREPPSGEPLLADADAPDEAFRELDAAECRAAVESALNRLPPRHRALMDELLVDTVGGYRDIAARLGMPVGSIGPTRGRCLALLRRDERLRRISELLD
jgi:RNA polymerase sigma factor (sigma-70 family)